MKIDELLTIPAWQRGDADVLQSLAELERVRRMVDAKTLELIGEVDKRGLAVAAGASSTSAWLWAKLQITPGRLAAGEACLLERARILDPSRLARAGREVAHRLDPDVADRLARGEQSAVERRELFLSENTWTGMWDLKATLDPLTGAALRAELEARSAPRPATDDGPDPRNPARRRADAFCDLIEGARRLPDPVPGSRAPVQLIVTTELETLRGGLERAGRTTDGTWLSPRMVRQLACDADVVPMVLGGNSEPLDVGRSRYVVPPAIRRALTARDQGCSAPGCDRPPGWCDAHHIKHWANGGKTKLKNLTLVCSFHHHLTHDDGWDITIGTDDIPEWLPPGWIDPARKPRRNARYGIPHLPMPPDA